MISDDNWNHVKQTSMHRNTLQHGGYMKSLWDSNSGRQGLKHSVERIVQSGHCYHSDKLAKKEKKKVSVQLGRIFCMATITDVM